jgi:addiction module HigA family antidote
MSMYNPPHLGEFIKATDLDSLGYSGRFFAKQLDVVSFTLNRILKGKSGITPEVLRLTRAVGLPQKAG